MFFASSIPEDIIISIVELFIHDRPTLKSCTLIAQSFRFPSQQLLYAEIRLHLTKSDPNPPTRAQQLHDIMSRTPLLGTFVRKLDLLCEAKAEDGAGVLNLMTQLRILKVVIPPQWGTDHSFSWESLGHGLRDGLSHLMQLPVLERVHLHGISGFPVENLPRSSQIDNITLSMISLDKAATFETLPSVFFRGFYFEADRTTIDIETCQSVLRMSANSLERFHLSVTDLSTGDLGKIFFLVRAGYSSNTVNEIDPPIGLQMLDLSPMKILQSVQISFAMFLSKRTLAEVETFLLNSIPVDNALLSFRLDNMMGFNWRSVDRILHNAACLSKAHISVGMPGVGRVPVEDVIESFMKPYMPHLFQRIGSSIYSEDQLAWTIQSGVHT